MCEAVGDLTAPSLCPEWMRAQWGLTSKALPFSRELFFKSSCSPTRICVRSLHFSDCRVINIITTTLLLVGQMRIKTAATFSMWDVQVFVLLPVDRNVSKLCSRCAVTPGETVQKQRLEGPISIIFKKIDWKRLLSSSAFFSFCLFPSLYDSRMIESMCC